MGRMAAPQITLGDVSLRHQPEADARKTMLGLLATLTEQRNALQTVNDALSTQYRTAEDQLHAALADVRTATSRCAELEDVLCTKVRWSALLGCERPSAGRGKEGGGRSASVDHLCECARACLRPYIHLPQRPPPKKFAALLNTKKRKIHELMAAIRENGTASAGASAHGRSQRP